MDVGPKRRDPKLRDGGFKESVKRIQEVREGTAKKLERISKNISSLVQLM